jgi:hypothetical protein
VSKEGKIEKKKKWDQLKKGVYVVKADFVK